MVPKFKHVSTHTHITTHMYSCMHACMDSLKDNLQSISDLKLEPQKLKRDYVELGRGSQLRRRREKGADLLHPNFALKERRWRRMLNVVNILCA